MTKKIFETKVPGQKNPFDTALKNIFSKKENFASVFNALCFKEKKLNADKLKNLNTVETVSLKMSDGRIITLQLFRDLAMLYDEEMNAFFCVLCIENQSKISYIIPVRNMSYDVVAYLMMLDLIKHRHKDEKDYADSGEFLSGFRRGDKIYPVFTLVLYYGEKPWDGPRSLKEMLYPVAPELEPFIQDYRCTIIDIKDIENGSIDSLSRDVKQLFSLLRHTYDGSLKEYCTDNKELKNVSDDVSIAVSYISKDKNLQKYIESNLGKGGINMESIFRNFKREAVQEGIGIGRAEGLRRGFSRGRVKGRTEGIRRGFAKGRDRGRIEGRIEGRDEGRGEGKTEDIVRLLAHGFEADNIARILNVSGKDVERIFNDNRQEIAKIAEENKLAK